MMFLQINERVSVNLQHVAKISLLSTTRGIARHHILQDASGHSMGSLDVPESEEQNEILDKITIYGRFIEINDNEAVNLHHIASIEHTTTVRGRCKEWRITSNAGWVMGYLIVKAGDYDNPTLKRLAECGMNLTPEVCTEELMD